MNCVVLIGPLHYNPLLARTTTGEAVATVHLLAPDGPSADPGAVICVEVPCVVPRAWLPELLRWQEQGFHVRVHGCLRRDALWYEGSCGVRTLQAFAAGVMCVNPATGAPTGTFLGEELLTCSL